MKFLSVPDVGKDAGIIGGRWVVPDGGSGRGPEVLRGGSSPLPPPTLKLPMVFKLAECGAGSGSGCGTGGNPPPPPPLPRVLDSSCSSNSADESASSSAASRVEGADRARVLLVFGGLLGWTGLTLVRKLGGADCRDRVWVWVWVSGSGNVVGVGSCGLIRFT